MTIYQRLHLFDGLHYQSLDILQSVVHINRLGIMLCVSSSIIGRCPMLSSPTPSESFITLKGSIIWIIYLVEDLQNPYTSKIYCCDRHLFSVTVIGDPVSRYGMTLAWSFAKPSWPNSEPDPERVTYLSPGQRPGEFRCPHTDPSGS